MLASAYVIYWWLFQWAIEGLPESIRYRTGEDYLVYSFVLEIFEGVVDYRVELALNSPFEWTRDGLY